MYCEILSSSDLTMALTSPFYAGQEESLLLPASELRLEVVSGPRNLKGTNLPMLNFFIIWGH